jgi:hypothetical protein
MRPAIVAAACATLTVVSFAVAVYLLIADASAHIAHAASLVR